MASIIKKFTSIFPFLIFAAACQPNEREFKGNNVYAVISDGSAWEAGTVIGVSALYNGNHPFTLDAASAGMTEGKFTWSKNLSSDPVAAYCPYDSSVLASSTKSVNLTLPHTQTQKGDGPDMRQDVMVSGTPTGSQKNGFTFTFVKKLARVALEIIPDAELEGDSLKSVSVKAGGKVLAGKYTMDLVTVTKPLTFSETSDKILLEFEDSPRLVGGQEVKGWIFAAAGVSAGDSISVAIETGSRFLTAHTTAADNWEEGSSQVVAIDIASLRAAGKITDGDNSGIGAGKDMGSVFTDIKTFGAFDLSKKPILSIVIYTEGEDQYGYYSNNAYSYFTILNIEKGFALKISVGKKDAAGSVTSLKTNQVGLERIPDNVTLNANCVKTDGHTAWYEDTANNIGYVIYKE